jgi:hypothetical protein
MHYRITRPTDEKVAEVFAATMEMLKSEKQMQKDRERLADVCCVPNDRIKISREKVIV